MVDKIFLCVYYTFWSILNIFKNKIIFTQNQVRHETSEIFAPSPKWDLSLFARFFFRRPLGSQLKILCGIYFCQKYPPQSMELKIIEFLNISVNMLCKQSIVNNLWRSILVTKLTWSARHSRTELFSALRPYLLYIWRPCSFFNFCLKWMVFTSSKVFKWWFLTWVCKLSFRENFFPQSSHSKESVRTCVLMHLIKWELLLKF